MLYDGIHEAIVSEEIWNTAHDRRLRTGVKREKTYSLEHEHLLSGILCCPICGAGMYGNVNRKKKKDGSRYKTISITLASIAVLLMGMSAHIKSNGAKIRSMQRWQK